MGLIDTHCHLYLEEFDPEQDELVRTARASGIEALVLPNVDLTTIDRMHALCDRFPRFAFPLMGLHPTSVGTDYICMLQEIEHHLSRRKYHGIGEIGIDLYWDKSHLREQRIVFEEQLRWSIDLDLPVAIHTRKAYPEVMESIHKIGADRLRGIFHCFTGTRDELADILPLGGFKIGIGGVITFKNSKLADTIREIPLDRIVLETDAPYLAPVPYRGKRNEPTYIWKTAEKVAETFGRTLEETVKTTRKSALELFKNIKTGE